MCLVKGLRGTTLIKLLRTSCSRKTTHDQDSTGILFKLVLISILLSGAVVLLYWQVSGFDFANIDDPQYVSENQVVGRGMSLEGLKWAFTEPHAANWHPLTWISHMLDVQIFGMKPGMHHLTNVFLHILNTIMLFLVLERMTGAMWRSAAVAALFALHPLHVESVAWISERKDVLSTLFWMLTLMGYLWYIRRRSVQRYLVVVILYALGLMSKPMLVTLPFVLLLLDYWPLNRLEAVENMDNRGSPGKRRAERPASRWSGLPDLVAEKIPLFVLAFASSIVTLYAQRSGGAMRTMAQIEFGPRVSNAVTSYVAYLGKMIWPANLAVFYPYPDMKHLPWIVFCVIVIVLVSAGALYMRKKIPYFMVGWLWYLGTLLPVIGIVQVGDQSMADRYTYIPLVGIFFMIVWGLSDVFAQLRGRKIVLGCISAVVFPLLMTSAWVQVGFWKNSGTLFKHALMVTENNYLAHGNLGVFLFNQGKVDEAIREYLEALRINPDFYLMYFDLGVAYTKKNEAGRAIEYYEKGLRNKPDDIKALNFLGGLLAGVGRKDAAICRYNESLMIDPHQSSVYNDLGNTYMHKGDTRKAIECYQHAISESPGYAKSNNNLQNALIVQRLQASLNADPQNSALHAKLGDVYRMMGVHELAIVHYQKALSIEPTLNRAMNGLVTIHVNRQEYAQALGVLQNMQKSKQRSPEISYNIACIYGKMGNVENAVRYLQDALNKGFSNQDLLRTDPDLKNVRYTEWYKKITRDMQ